MDVLQQLHVLGVSFQSAPLTVRETLSFTPLEAAELLKAVKRASPSMGCAILSTCNRTEFYLVGADADESRTSLFKTLKEARPAASIFQGDCRRYEFSNNEAIQHVLRVASGLESAVLGDVQVLTQIKECRRIATDAGTVGKYLNYVFDLAIDAGNQARQQTNISYGNASIGSAVVGMLHRDLFNACIQTKPRVIIVGAGKVAESVARQLGKNQSCSISIVNRTFSRAQRLALLCGGEACEWSKLPELLSSADVVIATTATAHPVITQNMLVDATRTRGGIEPLVIDAGVPRNVEHGPKCAVLDVDCIREQQDDMLRVRQHAIPSVEAVIAQLMDRWARWQAMLPVEAIVKTLFVDLNDQQRIALRKLADSQQVGNTEIEALLIRPMRKILHRHVALLRDCNPLRS